MRVDLVLKTIIDSHTFFKNCFVVPIEIEEQNFGVVSNYKWYK
jgi:hypothetical protein